MKITEQSVVEKIKNAGGWIDATELASFFGISTRTIRNYIKSINQTNPSLIYSSNKGYMINTRVYESMSKPEASKEDIPLERTKYVLNQLIVAAEPLDIYDLADELALSDTSFERVLHAVKQMLKPFEISLERKRNKIWLKGSEKNIRALIGKLLTTVDDSFVYFYEPFKASKEIDIDSLQKDIIYILESFGYYVSDYGLNTIMLHILIMIERIQNDNLMDELDEIHQFTAKEHQMVSEISNYLEKFFNVTISKADRYCLAVVVINNCAHTGETNFNKNNINTYLERAHIVIAEEISDALSNHYGLTKFSEDFIVTFSIHIMNLVKRAKDNTYTPNPLTTTFQGNYPLFYDMATFTAKLLHDRLNITINDDEISFLAFHIGAYLENTNKNKDKVNCCFVYAEYHRFHVKAIDKILRSLDNELYISSNISVKEINMIPEDVELVIASCPVPKDKINVPVIMTSLFVTDEDINNIYNKICKIKEEKTRTSIVNSLQYFIRENLFHKNLYFSSEQEAIHMLANECLSLNLVDSNYENEVLERENLSSSSFSFGVATPHSLNMNAKHSFLSVVVNDHTMRWGKNDVNIIIMIGTSLIDREAFKLLFDELIAILYEEENVRILAKCNNYEDFTSILSSMIKQQY